MAQNMQFSNVVKVSTIVAATCAELSQGPNTPGLWILAKQSIGFMSREVEVATDVVRAATAELTGINTPRSVKLAEQLNEVAH